MLNKANKVFLMSCLAVLLFSNGSLAEKEEKQPKVTSVFEVQDLFESVRIPNIVVTTDGTVLAFAKSGQLLRRSEDSGKSWGPIQEVGPDSGGSAIVDNNSGNVMMVNSKGGYLWRSHDQGKTWKRE
ncbi:MAG: exo-alpha-sialidase, partial [Phycisphaerales bacterium]